MCLQDWIWINVKRKNLVLIKSLLIDFYNFFINLFFVGFSKLKVNNIEFNNVVEDTVAC